MSFPSLFVTITGTAPLLQNNPQTVDRFNDYTKAMARINAKKTRRTDDDYRELADIEVRAKVYYDQDLGVYVPTSWLMAAIAANSFRVCKVSKADIRGSVFATAQRVPLAYRGQGQVKSAADIVGNPLFRQVMTLRQGQVRICKSMPIFHDWQFSAQLQFDDKIIDPDSLTQVIDRAARYGGFGDFRPTFGRATVEVTHG